MHRRNRSAEASRDRRMRRAAGPAVTRASRVRLAFERLEPRIVLDSGLLITEFMAVNESTLADVDGDFSDWIEIHNPTAAAINLDGWYLTDKPGNLTKWEFPGHELAPGEYLVVFASEKDRTDPAGQLHTNFKLAGGGEYLALVEPDGQTVALAYTPEFPPQFGDVSYGVASAAETTTLLAAGDDARAFVPIDDTLGDTWIDPSFDDTGWVQGTTGVGYETETGYDSEIGLDVQAEMFGVNSSAYVRAAFDVADLTTIDQLTLRMKYDDGFAAYLNGQEVAQKNSPVGGGESPDSGLISYWNFDENMNDTAGQYGNNSGAADDDFTVRSGGAARYVPGVSGQAVALDAAAGDALSLVTASSLDSRLGPVYTIEAWIYPTALYSWSRLALNWGGVGQAYHFALRNNNQVSLFHNQSNGTNQNVDGPGMVQLGSAAGWQHIAGVADGTHLRVYYNGTQVASTTYDGTIQSVAQGMGLGDMPVGGYGDSYRYQGYVDDLAVWNVALSSQQLASHHQAGPLGYGLSGGSQGSLDWDSAAARAHPDGEALQFEEIDISAHLGALRLGENVLAIHGLNAAAADADFLIVPELDAARLSPQPNLSRYFTQPTPATVNGTGINDLGPIIDDVPQSLPQPASEDDVTITASVTETNFPVASVTLHHRVMFGADVPVTMFDDGLHGDGQAGDGLFGASIPASASHSGQMLRWYVTADDTAGHDSRWPLFEDSLASPEYCGTVIADSAMVTDLPVLHRFIQNTSAAETGSGTRASVYYLGEFYDNVFVRIRGGTATSWPKKAYKFKFNEGHEFRFDPYQERVDEINVNTTYTDKSYVRAVLAYETHRDAGVPAAETFPLRMQQNGAFFSVAHFVEQPQPTFLRRHGLDDEGAFYKATQTTNGLTGSASSGIDKKYPKDNDFSDLQALIDGLALSGTAQENFVFDNVNLPAQISFLAAGVIMQNIDATDKNYFIYRDTHGTG
ncbi:MAG: CotH kinase family protein, partial [Candidatus Nealsonbacteria bacterium]|nr:CotH kinase family protein [Candidatus Nealsonbacteria bacterium]